MVSFGQVQLEGYKYTSIDGELDLHSVVVFTSE